MQQALTHDTLATTSLAGWLSCEQLAEEFWETPLPRTRPTPIATIPEEELPY